MPTWTTASPESQELNPSFPHGWQGPNYLWCHLLPCNVCISKKPEMGVVQGSNLGPQIWDVGILTSIFHARSNACSHIYFWMLLRKFNEITMQNSHSGSANECSFLPQIQGDQWVSEHTGNICVLPFLSLWPHICLSILSIHHSIHDLSIIPSIMFLSIVYLIIYLSSHPSLALSPFIMCS